MPERSRTLPVAVACIGNTHVRIAVAWGRSLRGLQIHPTREMTPAMARQWLTELAAHGATALAWASVVPRASRIWQAAIREAWPYPADAIRWNRIPGLEFRYPKPTELGADRLADLAAVVGTTQESILVIDAGTAVTCNALAHGRVFIGGAILPGPALMLDALARGTALLPRLTSMGARASLPARSTTEAIRAGVGTGWPAMVCAAAEQILSHAEMRGARIIATGGAAVWLRRTWPDLQIRPNLALRGLARWWRRTHA